MIPSQKYIFAVAALGAMLSMPAAAHHMSNDPDRVEEYMPADALEQHTLIVDEVLEMGVAQMAGTPMEDPTMTGTAMDPADIGSWSSSGNTTNPNVFREPPTDTLP
jgi:hypothetical protein